MNRTTGSILLIAVLLFSGVWLWIKLQTKAIEAQTEGINRAMDQIAPDSTHTMPALKRVHEVTDKARDEAEENQRLLDSLTQAALR
jgi:hypothetical protein